MRHKSFDTDGGVPPLRGFTIHGGKGSADRSLAPIPGDRPESTLSPPPAHGGTSLVAAINGRSWPTLRRCASLGAAAADPQPISSRAPV